MSRIRKSRIAITAVFAVAAVVLGGCTSGGGQVEGDTHKEAVYIEAITGNPQHLNSQVVNSPTVQRLSVAMMEPLVGLTHDYKVFPVLAEKWEFSKDGLEMTLHLRKGVTWHDGKPFTADDVKFNFEKVMPLQTYGPPMLAAISSVEAPDKNTVVLKLKSQYGPLLETLSQELMLPQHLYDGTDVATNPYNLKPVGTGPMMYESFASGEEVVLVKNPKYWGGEVHVDRAVYPIMADGNARTLALLSGDVDSAAVDPSQLTQVAAHKELVHLKDGYFPQFIELLMNAQNKFLSNPDVRAAVFSALDRKAILKVALSGQGQVAEGFFPPTLSWAIDKDVKFSKDFPYNADAINDKLDDLGYTKGADGLRFTLNAKYITTLTDTSAAGEQAKSMLADVGIGLNLEGLTSTIFTESVYKKSDFDLAFLRSTVGADPSLGIARWYVCNPDKMAARNPSGICDEKIEAAAASAAGVTDRKERAKYFKDMQQRIRELIFFAPLAWTNASFNTVNTSNWSGLDKFSDTTSAGNLNWLGMRPVE